MAEKPSEFSAEELKKMEERTKSDAAMIEGGAKYVHDEGAAEPRLELTRDEMAAIELEMRSDFEKTKDPKEEVKKKMDVIFDTLAHSRVSSSMELWPDKKEDWGAADDQKRFELERKLRSMNAWQIEKFLGDLRTDQVYVTSHQVESGGKGGGEHIRIWLKPPIQKGYPDWGSIPGGGLAEAALNPYTVKPYSERLAVNDIESGRELIEVMQGKKMKVMGDGAYRRKIYDLIEEVVIKGEKGKLNAFGGPSEYTRWLLRKAWLPKEAK